MTASTTPTTYKFICVPRTSPRFAELVTKFRATRLSALETDPASFVSQHATELALPLEIWTKRFSRDATVLICVASSSASPPLDDETALIEGEWAGFAALRGPLKYEDYYFSPAMNLAIPENPQVEARWYIYDVYTAPAHRGRGLAKKLINTCVELAVEGTKTLREKRKATLAERIADLDAAPPLDKGPWHKDSAFYSPNKTWKEVGDDCRAWEAERQRNKETKRLNRQLDGSRSRSSSIAPSTSRVNSFRSLNSATQHNSTSRVHSLKYSETGSTVSSVPSSNSGRSNRLYEVEKANKDDRIHEGHKAQEQQSRKPDTGKDCEQDITPYGGQGQRGFFGRHKGKNIGGWLPSTPQSQHAATYHAASASGSAAGSVSASRRSSATPQEFDEPV
ncbi:hypothetical protein N0V95_009839 [Ascochyta clinopodiicola]|nr:hypothetical protein N0V95_009839 [Ascochyta clinopodiicola]